MHMYEENRFQKHEIIIKMQTKPAIETLYDKRKLKSTIPNTQPHTWCRSTCMYKTSNYYGQYTWKFKCRLEISF